VSRETLEGVAGYGTAELLNQCSIGTVQVLDLVQEPVAKYVELQELYWTENKFFPWMEESLWWNQGSKGSNARYILCVSFKWKNWFNRFLLYISGIHVNATWAGQTNLTCSGTCTSKWRHVSNHVSFFLYPAVEHIPGEIIFYRGLHISHTRGWGEKNHFFIPRAPNHWKLTFPYHYSVYPRLHS